MDHAAYGGGIYIEFTFYIGSVIVTGCTLAGNTASQGGAIYNVTRWPVSVSGSAFSANSPDTIVGSYFDGGGNSGLP